MGNLGVLIPIFALMIPIVAIWTKHQQRMAEMGGGPSAPDSALIAAQNDKIRALEDRVKVLERIVTDGSYGVAAQIEALRDASTDAPTGAGIPLGLEKERL
jgi:hypothetical protein